MTAPETETVTVGALSATVVDAGSVLWAPQFPVEEALWRAEVPDADAEGRLRIALNGLLVRTGAHTVVVDPMNYRPCQASEWEHADSLRCVPGLDGLVVDAVDRVLITHSDHDHFSGVVVRSGGAETLRFPGVPHLIGRGDWEGNPDRGDPSSLLSARLGMVADAGLLTLVDGDSEIVPGVRMEHRPGETPGHSVIWFDAATPLGYLGDLISHPAEVVHPDWIPPGREPKAMLVSRMAVFEQAAATGAILTYSHAPAPYWGTIVPARNGWRWSWLDRRVGR